LKEAKMTKTRPVKYRLYIDESGDHTYSHMDKTAHRYLALLGVWFRHPDHYENFSTELDRFKTQFFGKRPDDPVVLHRSDIKDRKGAFGILQDKITQLQFDTGLVEIIHRANFKVCCVLLDKMAHRDKFYFPFHPYHYCLAAMLELYSGWLESKNAIGDVMAESRGTEEDNQLKQAYYRTYESGSRYFSHERHQKVLTSKEIKIKLKSANITGLQLADILAHPMKQSILIQKKLIDDPGADFGTRMIEAVSSKIIRSEGKGRFERPGIDGL
jgi:hypothetical protein